MPSGQSSFFDESFQTSRPPNPVFCHQDFLEKLSGMRNLSVGKRASLLMQRLAVDERRLHYKSTRGANQGWRRSRLGGNQGSHFYAWWAPGNAAPLKAGEGFRDAPRGSLFLRDIRHHDDHSIAHAQSFSDHYLPVSVSEMRREDYGTAPWTQPQLRFASARQPVRVLRGHPGSGKTTALLHAADACGAARVLYVTYSRELAGLARDYFDRYCSKARFFYVVTYDDLVRQLLDTDAPAVSFHELRRTFRGDLVPFQRSLGPWTEHVPALYDEMHAHLVGAALPVAVGRFAACAHPRSDDKNYRTRRIRYLGESAAHAALDLAVRLERSDTRPLAERYFPDLVLAWRAALALTGPGGPRIPPALREFDCIAVDECQDLTPIEAFVLVELAARGGGRGRQAGMFLAGDEAQTVRPTDFEWGWMNDLLHYRLSTPSEFKLGANLRSPRTIAQLVNRVWDLYSEIEKRDRPSGTGYAEIDDDSTDPVFYCTAAPGEELDALLAELAGREGVALVSLDERLTPSLPERVRPAVLTASEVKGLDFHTVCVLNAGPHLDRILKWHEDYRVSSGDIESIRRRLAIDELRVALSRPADRLIWLDVNPSTRTVRTTLEYLNRDHVANGVSPVIPAALRAALAEEQFDVEERIQRCQADARQYLAVKPDIAWSRAQQAVALLGNPDNPASVRDESVRQAAELTLAEICFCLGFRGVHLAPELGRPDLFREAAVAAHHAGRAGLATLVYSIAAVCRSERESRAHALGDFVQNAVRCKDELDGWLLAELASKIPAWMEELESAVTAGANAAVLPRILPPFYDVIGLPDAEARKRRLIDRAIRVLIQTNRYADALEILKLLPERDARLEAECHEALQQLAPAAETYRSLGMLKEALRCYRAIPDFEAAVTLIREMPDHPAAASYEWLMRLKQVLGGRPENFNRVMTAPEKKIFEQMLEEGLGVARKKPAARKIAAAKKAAAKKVVPKKSTRRPEPD